MGESQVAKGDVVMHSVDSVDMHSVVNDHWSSTVWRVRSPVMHSVHTDDSTIVGAPIIAPDEGCRQVTHGSFFSSSLQFTHWLVILSRYL